MKTKQIFAGIGAAAVLAMVTPAYAGGLLGGGAGALGGSMTSGIGGMTSQGAFDGRGAASTSFDRFPERPTPRAKSATTGAESAQRSGGGTAKAVSGSAAREAAAEVPSRAVSTTGSTAGSTAGSASTPTTTAPAPASKTPSPAAALPSAPPSTMTSATGAGSVDAQHSRGDNSVAVSGDASGSVSRTE